MPNRRKFLGALTGLICATNIPLHLHGSENNVKHLPANKEKFKFCLNTSTIRGQKLGLWGDIDIAAKAGYDGIELWIRDIRNYLAGGGSIKDLRRKIEDSGLVVENAIAFSRWIIDDPEIRNAELATFRQELELLAELGCRRIAAPPAGATEGKELDLFRVAERYRTILEIGAEYGVLPVLETWGFSANLFALGQAMFVAIESKHPDACILPDIYHLYRGGSDFSGLKFLNKKSVPMFHINDYPSHIERNKLADADRVFPGDGTAPISSIMKELKRINPGMVLSLELFNPGYWKMDALEAASTGLSKMKQVSQT